MAIIGILPASGKATRLGGLPKFCLPLPSQHAQDLGWTLLHWHVDRMLEVCDEVRICTRAQWAPVLEDFDLPAKVYVRKPTTMTEAILYMGGSAADRYIVGMPDTFIRGAQENHYAALVNLHSAVGVAAFDCPPALRGHVGQLDLAQDGRVLTAEDKQRGCAFPKMWGAMSISGPAWTALNPELPHPGVQLNEFVDRGWDVRAALCTGEYIDIGRTDGLARLYA